MNTGSIKIAVGHEEVAGRDEGSISDSPSSEELRNDCSNDEAEDYTEEKWCAEIVSNSSTGTVSTKRRYVMTERNARPRKKPARQRTIDEEVTHLANRRDKISCCKKLRCFRHSNWDYLVQKMKDVRRTTPFQRKALLKDMLCSDNSFQFDGKKVCSTFLKSAFCFTRKMQSDIRQLGTTIAEPISSADPISVTSSSSKSLTTEKMSPQRDAVIVFLERLADITGDKMPDRNEFHLPFFKKCEVYEAFEIEFKELHRGAPIPSISYFTHTWKQYCFYIKVRKHSRFAKCDVCETLRSALKTAVLKRLSTVELKAQKSSHLKRIWSERLSYKKNRDRAILDPNKYLSLIVDGADQSAFGLPHFTVKTKAERGHAIKVKLIGVLQHSTKNVLRLFTLTDEHETGANHIIESIHRTLLDLQKTQVLPRIFNLQVDNCTRENKNKYLFSYLESLVQWCLFDEVIVSFLPVGHTHEDIDQTFSRTSERLRSKDAITLKELRSELSNVYNNGTTVCDLDKIANWSTLCERTKCLTKISGISQYHYFRFYRAHDLATETPAPDGKTVGKVTRCVVKVQTSDEWESIIPNDASKSFILFCPSLLETPPITTKAPPDLHEVNHRLRSEEGRINSSDKMAELYLLRDRIYKKRTDSFHWDVSTGLELSHWSTSTEIDIGNSTAAGSTSNNYVYDLESFVAVNTHGTFWIARIMEVDDQSSKLLVHWYDAQSSPSPLSTKYSPSYVRGKTGCVSWTDKVPDESVIVNFDSLTKSKTLPMSVRKQLTDHCSKSS